MTLSLHVVWALIVILAFVGVALFVAGMFFSLFAISRNNCGSFWANFNSLVDAHRKANCCNCHLDFPLARKDVRDDC